MEQENYVGDTTEVQIIEEISSINCTQDQNCSLQQSSLPEDKKENECTTGKDSTEQNCSLQQSSLPEDKKENECTTRKDSTKIDDVPQNNVFLIDACGKPYEDNICDFTARREPVPSYIDSDAESDISSSSVSSLSSFSSTEDLKDAEKNTKATRQTKSVKTKGELGIEDLPPVEELIISVPEDDMEKIGTVYKMVDQLVVVESFENSRPLDLDSVLFLSNGKPLGHVFEVFGPVKQPYYLIRFNSKEDIVKKGIAKEDSVFYAPSHTNVTNFIFTDELMRQKGSDASWEHNNEPPEEHIDFSDDEKEMAARKKRAAKNRKPTTQEDAIVHKRPNPSFEARGGGRDAVTPDVTAAFPSKKGNYFRNYGRTGNSTSYSPVRATSVQRTTQNSEPNTSYRTTKSFAFAWPPSSQTNSPQRVPFQQNPVLLSPAVSLADSPSFTSLHINNQSMMLTSPCRTPSNFSLPTPSHLGVTQMMPSQQTAPQQSTMPLSPAINPVNPNNFTSLQEPNQNIASTRRIPGSFSLPPPSQPMPPQGVPPHQGPLQQGPPQGMPLQQCPPQGMPHQQGPLQGMPHQQGPLQGMPHQQGPPQGLPHQQGPPQGMPHQQGPPQGMPHQQGPPQGMPHQQGPLQGMPHQQGPPQGMLSHQGPPHGMPPQQGPPQHMPPQQGPPQHMPLQQGPPQGMPPPQVSFQQSPVPLSTHTFPVNPTNLTPVHGASQNVAQIYRTPGNYSVPPPSLTESPQRMSSQQMLIQSSSVPLSPAVGSSNLNRLTPSQGTNPNAIVAPLFRISENVAFSSPPSSLPGPPQRMPFQQNPVPLSSATTIANPQLSGSQASFLQTDSQRFQDCEKYSVSNISQNFQFQAFEKIPCAQQTPVSASVLPNTSPGSVPVSTTFSGRPSALWPSELIWSNKQ